ncbi:MAG: D-alanine--D-alanine ligase [Tissierella sp.]|nr:D-alanine--D-alanine ligase [Tissierella sp.]
MKKVVCVLFGGKSSEYKVSLMSASSVIENLNRNKYEVINIGITRDGKWLRYYGDIEDIINDTWYLDNCSDILFNPCKDGGILEIKENELIPLKIDLIFPVLHGRYGEDGAIQGLLEILSIPYIGCDIASSAICMDKDYAHRLVEDSGIKVPQSLVLNGNMVKEDIKRFSEKAGFPIYVKPASEGSSIGMTRAMNKDELIRGIEEAFEFDNKVVLEENIDGFEVGCAIIGNEELIIGEVCELELPNGLFLDYKEKYKVKNINIHIPARIDNLLKDRIINTAKDIYRILGCSGLARVDMFIDKDESIIFNEVNTMPGFTTTSIFPKMFISSNMTYGEILDQLIEIEIGDCK